MKKIQKKNNSNPKKESAGKIRKFLKKYYLLILVGLLIILTCTLVIMKFTVGKNLDADSKKVQELYKYISNEELNKCEGLVHYDDELVTYETLSDEVKMCIAFNQEKRDVKKTITLNKDKKDKTCTLAKGKIFAVDEYEKNKCTIKTYNPKEINEMYKKIYNKDVPKDLKSFQVDDYNVCYLHKDKYYCGLSETFSFTIGNDALVYRVINKVAQKGSSIVVYDYFIKINNDKCYKSYVGTKTNDTCKLDNIDKNKISYKFLKKYGTMYKHTFTKVKGNHYSWTSSEPV